MERRIGFSLAFYAVVFTAVFLLQSLFFSGSSVPEIPYSTFLDRVDQNHVERVVITDDKIYRLVKDPSRPPDDKSPEDAHKVTPGADPVQKVSIVPRGQGALGYTLQAPLEDRYLMSRTELLGRVRTLLAGRAAEEIVFGEISTGASDDLEKASQIVREMLIVYGMSEHLPNLSLVSHDPGFLGPGDQTLPHSQEIERTVGEEQLRILQTCYEEAKYEIQRRREQLEALANRLLEKEKLEEQDLVEVLGLRPAEVS